MNWLDIVKAFAPVAIQFAESAHPLPGSGKQKLATAAGVINTVLTIAAASGAIPPQTASDAMAVTTIINQNVAQLNNTSGVPKLPK